MSEEKQYSNREASERWLEVLKDKHATSKVSLQDGIAFAHALAEVAVAEQLERLNDQLAEVIDPPAGIYQGVVRVRTEASEG